MKKSILYILLPILTANANAHEVTTVAHPGEGIALMPAIYQSTHIVKLKNTKTIIQGYSVTCTLCAHLGGCEKHRVMKFLFPGQEMIVKEHLYRKTTYPYPGGYETRAETIVKGDEGVRSFDKSLINIHDGL